MTKSAVYLLLSLFFATNSLAQPLVWKIQSNKPANSFMLSVEQHMMNQIKRESQGSLILELKESQGYVSDREAYNALRTGIIDGMLMTPSYWGGADPIFAIFGDLVAAWNSPAQYLRWLDQVQGGRYLQQAYQRVGLRMLGYVIAPMESLISTKPLTSIDDLKGQILRAPPGMISDFFTQIGARPRNIPGNRVLKLMQQGRIHSADYSDLVVNYQTGAYQIAKYTNYPGFHSMPLYDFVVREVSWQALTDSQREAVMNAIQVWQSSAYKASRKKLEKTKKLVLAQGVTIHQWSELELKRARQQATIVWDKYASKSVAAKKLIDELKRWLQNEGNLD